MVIYEVNLSVDNSVAEAFSVWLRTHIPEILALPGFVDATWYFRDPDATRQLWSVHYRLADWKSLRHYLDDRADAMRQEGIDLFGDQFTAERRILFEREHFSAPEAAGRDSD